MLKTKTKKEVMMMKIKKLFGFTLAELLVVFLIIGFCTIVALDTVKPSQKKTTRYLYMRAYQTLSKAYYNGIIIGYNPFTDVKFEDIEPVHTDSKDSGAQILCKGLTYWINSDTDPDGCSSTALTNVNAENMGTALFNANNKMAFYTTKRLGDDNFKFYVVFIDINGANKGPNSIIGDSKHLPDIYAFALLDTGRVCPIGRPEYDKDIMTARLAYYEDGEPNYTHNSLAYYQAKGAAWGYYSNINDAETNQMDEIFTMNDLIRSKLEGSKIYKDFPDLSTLEPVEISSGPPYNCSVGDFETCFIFLDEYR